MIYIFINKHGLDILYGVLKYVVKYSFYASDLTGSLLTGAVSILDFLLGRIGRFCDFHHLYNKESFVTRTV